MVSSYTKIVALAFAIAFLCGLSQTSFAQDAATDNNVNRPLTAEGSAAFIFNLGGIGTFGFQGPSIGPLVSGVGMKYYISDGLALRILAGLNTGSGNPANADSTSAKPSETDFGIGVGIEDHLRPFYSTSPYIGAQVSFGSSSEDNGGSGAAEIKESSSDFNVGVLAGFDWFMTKGMAIGGEMNLGFTSGSSSKTIGSQTNNNQSTTDISLATGGNVHFLVYF